MTPTGVAVPWKRRSPSRYPRPYGFYSTTTALVGQDVIPNHAPSQQTPTPGHPVVETYTGTPQVVVVYVSGYPTNIRLWNWVHWVTAVGSAVVFSIIVAGFTFIFTRGGTT